MFDILMNVIINDNVDENNVLDYDECSDYRLGLALGITREKVRNLKIKKQARYPVEFDWKKSFDKLRENLYYDNKKIIIPMNDPNLYESIRNYIEEKGGYIEIARGNNYLQMRPEHFLMLIYYGVEDSNEKAELRKKLALKIKQQNEEFDIDSIKTDKEMSEYALGLGESVFDLFIDLAEGISNPLVGVLKCVKPLIKIVKNNV